MQANRIPMEEEAIENYPHLLDYAKEIIDPTRNSSMSLEWQQNVRNNEMNTPPGSRLPQTHDQIICYSDLDTAVALHAVDNILDWAIDERKIYMKGVLRKIAEREAGMGGKKRKKDGEGDE